MCAFSPGPVRQLRGLRRVRNVRFGVGNSGDRGQPTRAGRLRYPCQSMGARILIVDDEPEDAELTRRRLSSLGAEIVLHDGPEGAVAEMHTGSYDLVLLDVNMPGFSGLQILGAMDKARVKGKVVLFSSIEERGLQEMAASAGVDYLSKSLSKNDLVARVGAFLAG